MVALTLFTISNLKLYDSTFYTFVSLNSIGLPYALILNPHINFFLIWGVDFFLKCTDLKFFVPSRRSSKGRHISLPNIKGSHLLVSPVVSSQAPVSGCRQAHLGKDTFYTVPIVFKTHILSLPTNIVSCFS